MKRAGPRCLVLFLVSRFWWVCVAALWFRGGWDRCFGHRGNRHWGWGWRWRHDWGRGWRSSSWARTVLIQLRGEMHSACRGGDSVAEEFPSAQSNSPSVVSVRMRL